MNATVLIADRSGNRDVDLADYDLWRMSFGHTANVGGATRNSTVVPEPAALALSSIGGFPVTVTTVFSRRSRRNLRHFGHKLCEAQSLQY